MFFISPSRALNYVPRTLPGAGGCLGTWAPKGPGRGMRDGPRSRSCCAASPSRQRSNSTSCLCLLLGIHLIGSGASASAHGSPQNDRPRTATIEFDRPKLSPPPQTLNHHYIRRSCSYAFPFRFVSDSFPVPSLTKSLRSPFYIHTYCVMRVLYILSARRAPATGVSLLSLLCRRGGSLGLAPRKNAKTEIKSVSALPTPGLTRTLRTEKREKHLNPHLGDIRWENHYPLVTLFSASRYSDSVLFLYMRL